MSEYILFIKKEEVGTSLVVPGLRFYAPNAGGLGLIPGHGTDPTYCN